MIVITGASRGIGKYLFNHFIEAGEVVLGTFNSTYPEPAEKEYFTKVNISNYSDVTKWIDIIKDKISKLILINCAGNNYNSFAHKSDIDTWSNVINVNLIGTFNVIRAVLPIMREQGYGRIINFASIVAQVGIPGTSAYATSKAGLWGLVKSIAVENAKRGITINNLNLGYFDIGMIKEVPLEFQEKIKHKIPGGDFGDPVDIIKAVSFLIETDYINGSSIDVNGGIL
ncbi:SDR family NAD(P)-dependent oxidoreductase [Desulfobacula sp.]|uniref:SDR family NAD(P)-dependent oxidoreductase n=1 Tax=Desulfobacula sp. TaxID=2593537 RepID=UPI0025B9E137|nr:SDR family NAD(P)-dependent oxidoreductase [Desulfobacula sp.]MBC2704237.1 SDR family oxidoreductase [Desulfobacula sp.]